MFSLLTIIDPASGAVRGAVPDIYGLGLPPLGLVTGRVTNDMTATSRRRFSCTLADPTGYWAPTDQADALSIVSGNWLKVETGYVIDGAPELKPQGVFVIDEPSVDDSDQGTRIELSGEDLSRVVRDNAFSKPYTVTQNQSIVAAAQTLLRNRWPGIKFRGLDVNSTSYTTPWLVYDENQDPWEAAAKLLASGGLEVFMDAAGFAMIQQVPDLAAGSAVWTYGEGELAQTSRLRGASRRADIYNGVLAIGENTLGISAARAEVWDDDPASPTYAGTETNPGRFGRKLKKLEPNAAIRTNAQAAEAARADLRKSRRLSTAWELELRAHPCHEGGDLVQLQRAKLGLDGFYILERFEVGLSAADKGTARVRQRVA